jgi:hypothetical protein
MESGNLVDEVSHTLHIQTAGARSQQARAELGDNAAVGNFTTFGFLLAHVCSHLSFLRRQESI